MNTAFMNGRSEPKLPHQDGQTEAAPAKVFGIGLSRTGTTSLTAALEILGYHSAHFPCDPTTQREIYTYRENRKDLRLTILDTYEAITDTPVCCVYEALDRSYPSSKFILTVRNKSEWLHSCERYWNEGLPSDIQTVPDQSYVTFINFVNAWVYGAEEFDAARFSGAYDRYMDDAIKYFTHRNTALLVLDICAGETWDQLCPFLNVRIPDLPFPSEHGRFFDNAKQVDATASERGISCQM